MRKGPAEFAGGRTMCGVGGVYYFTVTPNSEASGQTVLALEYKRHWEVESVDEVTIPLRID